MQIKQCSWILLVVLLISPNSLFGQENGDSSDTSQEDDLPSFQSLRTPTSPGFTLLGIAPTAVERPNTPSDLALSFAKESNALSELPKEFALETSPYWLISHPHLEFKDDITRSVLKSILRTFTISVATAQVGTTDAPVTGLAVGARTSILSGQISEESQKRVKTIRELLKKQIRIFNEARDENEKLREWDEQLKQRIKEADGDEDALLKIAEEDLRRRGAIEKEVMAEIQPELNPIRAEIEAYQEQYPDLATAREGLYLEAAGGGVWEFPDNIWNQREFKRWGLWGTAGYQLKNSPVSFVGLVRYLDESEPEMVGEPSSNSIDAGLRAIYSQRRYAVSLEAISRSFTNSDLERQYRIAGVVEYKVAKNTWLQATFGRDSTEDKVMKADKDADPKVPVGELIAQLGITFNFSTDRFKFPKE